MPDVAVPLDDSLFHRVAVSAGARNGSMRNYCRVLLTAWLNGGAVVPGETRAPVGKRRPIRVPLSDGQYRALRVTAAGADLGHAELASRVLESACPPMEELAAALVWADAAGKE